MIHNPHDTKGDTTSNEMQDAQIGRLGKTIFPSDADSKARSVIVRGPGKLEPAPAGGRRSLEAAVHPETRAGHGAQSDHATAVLEIKPLRPGRS